MGTAFYQIIVHDRLNNFGLTAIVDGLTGSDLAGEQVNHPEISTALGFGELFLWVIPFKSAGAKGLNGARATLRLGKNAFTNLKHTVTESKTFVNLVNEVKGLNFANFKGNVLELRKGILEALNLEPSLAGINGQVYNMADDVVKNTVKTTKGSVGGGGDAILRNSDSIKFSQKSISPKFSDGRKLSETIATLKAAPNKANAIEEILLARFNDLPVDLQTKLLAQGANTFDVFAITGNRRLYAAKVANSQILSRYATKAEIEGIDLFKLFSTESAGRGLPIIK